MAKTVETRKNWRCKIFSLKIRRCKFLDKFHVCISTHTTCLLIFIFSSATASFLSRKDFYRSFKLPLLVGRSPVDRAEVVDRNLEVRGMMTIMIILR